MCVHLGKKIQQLTTQTTCGTVRIIIIINMRPEYITHRTHLMIGLPVDGQ